MRPRFEAVVSWTLVFCALSITTVVVGREFSRSGETFPGMTAPVFVENWEDLVGAGITMGSSSAPVIILVFADLQCPYCRVLDRSLRAIQRRYENEVAVVFLHYASPGHPLALAAGRALECADEASRAEEFMRALYDHQESLGPGIWGSFAADAGIQDTIRFTACVKSRSDFPRIARGAALAEKLKLLGTPTLIINGWRLPPGADSVALMGIVEDVRAGEAPSWRMR